MSGFHAIIFDAASSEWLGFKEPLEIISTSSLEEIPTLLSHVENTATSSHQWALGWLSYEASSAFDSSLTVKAASDFPLVWFGLYAAPEKLSALPPATESPCTNWSPSITEEEYLAAIDRIRSHIAQGDTYQVNFSFRMHATAPRNAYMLFCRMVETQGGAYSFFLDTGRFVVCSASPELFFQKDKTTIVCRPMKGTAPRGVNSATDSLIQEALQTSTKERAENVMIVDMVRNDLSRVAQRGTVAVRALCTPERYPNVFQLTSEVRAETDLPISKILQGLFPSASITGAPKARTMEIISRVETTPRNLYTGALGVITPDNRSWFNVAIRTAVVDREHNRVEYGVGSGVVWDSHATSEYRECVLKATAVTTAAARYELFETLLWEPGQGFFLLDRHLQRLNESALYLGWPFNMEELRHSLEKLNSSLESHAAPLRIRFVLNARGDCSHSSHPLTPLPSHYRVSLATEPVDSSDRRLYHKTTDRSIYDTAKAKDGAVDDVLLWNERNELTESRIANLVVSIGGVLYTPPVTSGLLPGCYRAELLEQRALNERVLYAHDLIQADALYLINSLRKMWKIECVFGED